MLWFQFTMGTRRRLPDPSKNWDAFIKFSVFGLEASGSAVSYSTMNTHIKELLRTNGIFISKVCHAFRASGAQWADYHG
jgi:hypothetical protein